MHSGTGAGWLSWYTDCVTGRTTGEWRFDSWKIFLCSVSLIYSRPFQVQTLSFFHLFLVFMYHWVSGISQIGSYVNFRPWNSLSLIWALIPFRDVYCWMLQPQRRCSSIEMCLISALILLSSVTKTLKHVLAAWDELQTRPVSIISEEL
jgi:hypothetical protein